jgi:hypothetical protein
MKTRTQRIKFARLGVNLLFKDANSTGEGVNAPNEDIDARIDSHAALLQLNIGLFALTRAR